MSTYVMSDIHGAYEAYLKMLDKISFSDGDALYILGDVLDRGKNPIGLFSDICKRPGVFPILGNHEAMAIPCLELLSKPVTEENIEKLTAEQIETLCTWQLNGGVSTTDEFHKLSEWERNELLLRLSQSPFSAEISAGGNEYILVHAGLKNFSPERPIKSYDPDELIWESPDYERAYFKDKFLVTGHTPTSFIEGNPRPNKIYRRNNHIATDCGAGIGGNLGCLRLDDGEEFYVKT